MPISASAQAMVKAPAGTRSGSVDEMNSSRSPQSEPIQKPKLTSTIAVRAPMIATCDSAARSNQLRSLAHLPDVKHAQLFEPKPEHIYSWSI